jgi:hypothetical protein
MLGRALRAAIAAAGILAAAPAHGFDIQPTPDDPAVNRQAALAELVVGPAPAGYAPLLPPSSGLQVVSISYAGVFTHDVRTTAACFQRNLVVGSEALEPGIFLGTGRPLDAEPPNRATDTSGTLDGREDALAEVVSRAPWSYDAQRLAIDFVAGPGTNSLRFRWVFGTEEYPEFVGSSYDDVFAVFLFRDGETGPLGGQFYQHAPTYRELADAGSSYFLTDDQADFLRRHQIAFDSQGAPITVNGPFFSGGAVVVPPANGLEYDGSTKILETVAPLVPGQRYTLYIVIADTDDQIYDSGVFIASLAGRTETETGPRTGFGGGATTGTGTGTGSGAGTGTGPAGSGGGGAFTPGTGFGGSLPGGSAASGSGAVTGASSGGRSGGGCAAAPGAAGAGGAAWALAMIAAGVAARRRGRPLPAFRGGGRDRARELASRRVRAA